LDEQQLELNEAGSTVSAICVDIFFLTVALPAHTVAMSVIAVEQDYRRFERSTVLLPDTI
jgi:hypothetical protein